MMKFSLRPVMSNTVDGGSDWELLKGEEWIATFQDRKLAKRICEKFNRRAAPAEEYFQDEPKIPETREELERGFIELRAALSYAASLAGGLVQHYPPTLMSVAVRKECQEIKDEAMKVLERYDL